MWKSSSDVVQSVFTRRSILGRAVRANSAQQARNISNVTTFLSRAVNPSAMDELPPSTGSIAKSRPTTQSCRMRVPIMIWPWREECQLRSWRHLRTNAVDDIERNAPTNTPSWTGAPASLASTPHRNMRSRI
mmetsp:Transcript_27637/g.33550  ORF Transcript_27637/g.33550 Transcript_27637/m.33550 type:complete len:132 (+) Transcript_27637:172-567(+)